MSKRAIFFAAALLCSVAVYQLPYLLTLAKTGWSPLPPVFVADEMLYLNLSAIHHASATEVLNPWYGNLVRAVDVPHLQFPITFLLFHFTHAIFRSWTLAVLVWAAFWAAVTFVAAVFCLDSLFPDSKPFLTITGAFALLVLQSPLVYAEEIRQLPSAMVFLQMRLPYLRFAIPQVIVPVVLAYWGLQVRALKNGSKLTLAGMALLQFALCAAFPYFLPVVALGTGITILIFKCQGKEIALSWPATFVFAIVCGAMDIGYFVLAGVGKSHGNVQVSLQFRPELILPSLRAYVLLLVVAAGLALVSRASLAARTTVAGMALSNALFGFSNVFLPAEAQMLDHPTYIIALTTWLPLLVFGWAFLEQFDSRPFRTALIGMLALIGAWEGYAGYRSSLPTNLLQAAAIEELEKLVLTAKDLVIAPAQFSDDISSWIPLVSPAKVLFTSDGENILSASDTRTEQTFRQGVYLTTAGMTPTLFTSMTESATDFRFNALVQQGDRAYQRSPLAADRLHAQLLVRERLGPLLARLYSEPALTRDLLAAYERIIVIDSSSNPFFDPPSFSRWLAIERQYEHNGTRVWICRPKLGP
jgi:hypothetical protein